MKVRLKSTGIELEVEGATHKEVFREIAAGWEEVFASEACGCCKSNNVRLRVRNVEKAKKKYEYFEKVCLKCGARLAYGQHLEGGSLFPKRKVTDEKGEEVYDTEHRGWAKWKKEDDVENG